MVYVKVRQQMLSLLCQPENSLPYPKEPTIDPYPEPDEYNPHFLTLFFKIFRSEGKRRLGISRHKLEDKSIII
jgi:hypothetical protein